jgi:hypothetical protein
MRTILPHNSPLSLEILRGSILVPLALLFAAAFGGTQMSWAQTGGVQTLAAPAAGGAHPSASTYQPVGTLKRHAAVKALQGKAQGKASAKAKVRAQIKTEATAAQAAPAPATPMAPELPKWPANEKAAPATVTWDSQGLRIEAANSSLEQILTDVAAATGAKVEGLSADQRVFGAYGPGPARDVLLRLLQGSGYNVMMIGDQGQGTPRKIVLTSPHAGSSSPAVGSAPANDSDNDDDADSDEQPTAPPARPGIVPNGQPRSPQQIMQEMQQRQQRQSQGQPPENSQN